MLLFYVYWIKCQLMLFGHFLGMKNVLVHSEMWTCHVFVSEETQNREALNRIKRKVIKSVDMQQDMVIFLFSVGVRHINHSIYEIILWLWFYKHILLNRFFSCCFLANRTNLCFGEFVFKSSSVVFHQTSYVFILQKDIHLLEPWLIIFANTNNQNLLAFCPFLVRDFLCWFAPSLAVSSCTFQASVQLLIRPLFFSMICSPSRLHVQGWTAVVGHDPDLHLIQIPILIPELLRDKARLERREGNYSTAYS